MTPTLETLLEFMLPLQPVFSTVKGTIRAAVITM